MVRRALQAMKERPEHWENRDCLEKEAEMGNKDLKDRREKEDCQANLGPRENRVNQEKR